MGTSNFVWRFLSPSEAMADAEAPWRQMRDCQRIIAALAAASDNAPTSTSSSSAGEVTAASSMSAASSSTTSPAPAVAIALSAPPPQVTALPKSGQLLAAPKGPPPPAQASVPDPPWRDPAQQVPALAKTWPKHGPLEAKSKHAPEDKSQELPLQPTPKPGSGWFRNPQMKGGYMDRDFCRQRAKELGMSRRQYEKRLEAPKRPSSVKQDQVYLQLRSYRRGHGDARALDDAQRHHQQLFVLTYDSEIRPKHHLRMHLPAMYQTYPYRDCFACETKMRDYKSTLADNLGSLWCEKSGKLSRHILARMLNITVTQQNDFLVGKTKLHGQIYKEEDVAKCGGGHCQVSTKAKTFGRTLSQNDIIFWGIAHAGQICFFAQSNEQILAIVTLLSEKSSHVPGTRKFLLTEEKDALVVDDLPNLQLPSWWYAQGSEVLCLL
eukprot:Skav205226  [mRNA]  locus=scaffold1794:6668:15889:- [translate_table: standard]